MQVDRTHPFGAYLQAYNEGKLLEWVTEVDTNTRVARQVRRRFNAEEGRYTAVTARGEDGLYHVVQDAVQFDELRIAEAASPVLARQMFDALLADSDGVLVLMPAEPAQR